MSFSATDAAFEGFRLVRANPMNIVFWSLVYLVFFALAFAVVGSSLANIMATTQALEGAGDPSAAELETLGRALTGFVALVLPLSLVVTAIFNTAVARAVVRPGAGRFGALALGIDELRVLLVSFVLALVLGAVAIVSFGLVGLLAGIVQTSGQPILWLVVFIAGLAACAVLIWLSVKLSLAVPITVAERKIALFDSFVMTRGRFWPLLGMAIIALVMTMLVSVLGSIVAAPLTLLTGAAGIESLATFEGRPTGEIFQAAAPVIVVWCVLNAIFSALQLAVIQGPFSAAYLQIKGAPNV